MRRMAFPALGRDGVSALPEGAREDAVSAERGQLAALLETIEKLSAARSAQDVAAVVSTVARRVCGADGVSFVLREGGECHYLDEDAIGPLWKGRRFPMESCVSGWSMLNGRTAVVPDIHRDERIPHDVYRPTFVRSLVMTPVRPEDPIAAIGAYWSQTREFTPEELAKLEAVARATATALENVRLIASLEQALSQRDLMIRELDHRVKNNLASVQAIAQQTLRSAGSPERFSQAFSGRLMALSRAQELVAEAAAAGVGLEEVIRQGVGAIGEGRVRLSGPPVLLTAETAANVLMGAHELAANAAAHGALSSPGGEVEAAWAVADGRLQLEWIERGGPGAAAPERQGFGLRMLTAGLPRSLGGDAALQFEADGLVYRLSAPLSQAVRAPSSS